MVAELKPIEQKIEIVSFKLPNGGWTDEQFFEFCQLNKDLKIERRSNGEIILMGLTGGETANSNSELNIEIGIWNRKHKLGKIFDSSGGFKLPNGANYSPDLSWIPNEKWEKLTKKQRKKFLPLAPDFLCELLSNKGQTKLVHDKVVEFIDNGSLLAWVIDPFKKITSVYRPSIDVVEIPFDQPVFGGKIMPGLEIIMDEIIITD